MITETDEVARALDDAEKRWPDERDARAKLLLRLVKEGHQAIIELKILGPEAGPAVPLILPILNHREEHRARNALTVLADIGPGAAKAVPILRGLLRHPTKGKQYHGKVCRVLGNIGPAAAPAVPELSAGLRDHMSDQCYGSIKALGKIGPGAEAAIPALSQALKDNDHDVQYVAGTALGQIGPAAIPVLRDAMEETEWLVRINAARALLMICGVPGSIESPQHKD